MPQEPPHDSLTSAGFVAPTTADVLAAYVEPIVAGRRVALVGAAGVSIARRLVEAGARLVYVYETRPGGAPTETSTARKVDAKISVATYGTGDLGVREGAFDVVLAADLVALGDAEIALAQVRRLVGSEGLAFVACRNDDATGTWLPAAKGSRGAGPTYGALFDLCALQFADVRMLGVAPFAAYAVAEFAPDREPSIAFDASLVETPETPEWFVAVLSQRRAEPPESYAVVQLPSASIARVVHTIETKIAPPPAAIDLTELRARDARIKILEGEVSVGRESLDRAAMAVRHAADAAADATRARDALAHERDALLRERASLEQRLASAPRAEAIAATRDRLLAIEAELVRTQRERDAATHEFLAQRERAGRLEKVHTDLAATARTLEKALGDARRQLLEREHEHQALLAKVRPIEERLARHAAELAKRDGGNEAALRDAQAHAQRAVAVVARLEAELHGIAATHQHDVATLENALRARGDELRAARVELSRRDRLVRELVARIEERDSFVIVTARAESPKPDVSADVLERARRELAAMLVELRKRDEALTAAQASVDALTSALDVERARVDAQARDAARREAALQTAGWRIAELEKLSSPSSARSFDASDGAVEAAESTSKAAAEPRESDRGKLLAELAALRQALAQEHASHAASSADRLQNELAAARTAIAERDALIAQLSSSGARPS